MPPSQTLLIPVHIVGVLVALAGGQCKLFLTVCLLIQPSGGGNPAFASAPEEMSKDMALSACFSPPFPFEPSLADSLQRRQHLWDKIRQYDL